jgi:hypothetical protein
VSVPQESEAVVLSLREELEAAIRRLMDGDTSWYERVTCWHERAVRVLGAERDHDGQKSA